MKPQNHLQNNEQRSFQKESRFLYQTQYQIRFQQKSHKPFSQMSFPKPTTIVKKNVPFKPDDP